MKNVTAKKDILTRLIEESLAYKSFEDMEKLWEEKGDLHALSVQPLYLSLQSLTSSHIAQILPRLSPEQRKALVDLDMWKKDEVIPQSVSHWIEIYSQCPSDEVKLEFIQSTEFLLMLKNQFTISTFDVEDPYYPESNNYFLTEDHLLLIEYPENFLYASELKKMIQLLYADKGVENAYAFLFKLVVDSYFILEEEAYQQKKDRLKEFGFIDYYDALEYCCTLPSEESLSKFIDNKLKTSLTPQIDSIAAHQKLHSTSVAAYQEMNGGISEELSRISAEDRKAYLQFSFVKLVNARITLGGALTSGPIAMGQVGEETKQKIDLGFSYLQRELKTLNEAHQNKENSHLFDSFDFFDLFKIGSTLFSLEKRNLKEALKKYSFDDTKSSLFLGHLWNDFIERIEPDLVTVKKQGVQSSVKTYDDFLQLKAENVTFISALPYVKNFYVAFQKLLDSGILQDQFYINYDVSSIDFEAIILSSFINFCQGHYQDGQQTAGKMGVLIEEFKVFYSKFFTKVENEFILTNHEEFTNLLNRFILKFGLDSIPHFHHYLKTLCQEQLNGYDLDEMDHDDFKHVGGPIILNQNSKH